MLTKNTYSLDLEFLSPYPLGKEGFPGHAVAHITVKTFSNSKDGFPSIGHECASYSELEHQIDELKKELEEIREAGKRKFASHDKQAEEWRADSKSSTLKDPIA